MVKTTGEETEPDTGQGKNINPTWEGCRVSDERWKKKE